MLNALPANAALPSDYEKWMPDVGLGRIRRGDLDATLILQDNSRFFSARKGGAVVQAVRFATSFFGKGQFVPASTVRRDKNYVMTQSLSAPYYQPLEPAQKVDYKNWAALRDTTAKEVADLRVWSNPAIVTGKAGRFRFAASVAGEKLRRSARYTADD